MSATQILKYGPSQNCKASTTTSCPTFPKFAGPILLTMESNE